MDNQDRTPQHSPRPKPCEEPTVSDLAKPAVPEADAETVKGGVIFAGGGVPGRQQD